MDNNERVATLSATRARTPASVTMLRSAVLAPGNEALDVFGELCSGWAAHGLTGALLNHVRQVTTRNGLRQAAGRDKAVARAGLAPVRRRRVAGGELIGYCPGRPGGDCEPQ